MTSVKEFRVEEEPTADSLGQGAFVFTDDYSVFDWGKMPDEIPDKGASLCTMGAFNFEALEAFAVPTHYRGVVTPEEDEPVPIGEADEAPTEMAIELTRVPDLPNDGRDYDYDAYHEEAGENYLVPLEVVFRNSIPVGSSLRARRTPADYGLDFDSWPDRRVELDDPIVEFSTKFEETDRYLPRQEAERVAGEASLADLERLARKANEAVTTRAAESGLRHEDGKIECLYFRGDVRVADVVGTFDENRFTYEGQHVSKEVLRQYHKRSQPGWVEAVADAKLEAGRQDVADWQSLCEAEPEPLDEAVVRTVRDLYCAGTNAYTNTELFDAPPLAGAVDAVREL